MNDTKKSLGCYIVTGVIVFISLLLVTSCQKELNKEYYEAMQVCAANHLTVTPHGGSDISCGY